MDERSTRVAARLATPMLIAAALVLPSVALSETRPAEARPSRSSGSAPSFGSRPAIKTVASVQVGERVLHTTFGLGTVIATHGSGEGALADIDFGSVGVKRLSLRHAPMEKL